MKKSLTFFSEHQRIAAQLYYPDPFDPSQKYPAIVLCHGFAGTKEILLPAFAESFASQGFLALVFDYRGFGESEGERGRLIHTDQVRDIRNAITFLQSLPEVDPERIGLWGTSYGGANAIACAAADQRVRCLVVQLTFGSGERVILNPLDADGQKKLRDTLAKVWTKTVVLDKSLSLSPAQLLTDPQSKAFFTDLLTAHPELNVKIPFLFIQYTMEYKPEEYLPRVQAPCLIIAAEKDEVNPASESESLFANAHEPKELYLLKDATHYECYTGTHFLAASQKASQWFSQYLK